MSEYSDTDTIVLFKHNKQNNEKAPDYSGNLYDANGKKRQVAMWLRESNKTGVKFMSGKVEDMREQSAPQEPHQSRAEPQGKPEPAADELDSIPF